MKKLLLLLLSFVIVIIIYIFSHFNLFYISDINGYYFSNDAIFDNINNEKTIVNSKIKTKEINLYQNLYKYNKNIYIGEKTKTNVNVIYPIFSKDNSQIVNLSNNSKLVQSDFSVDIAYKGLIIASGKTYNQSDYRESNKNEYYFLKLENGLYVNSFDIKYTIDEYEFIIPQNSIILFEENKINYYVKDNNNFMFKSINLVNKDGFVEIKGILYNYYDFLNSMHIINFEEEEKPNVTMPIIQDISIPKDEVVEVEKPTEYVKPQVDFNKFTSKVYSANGDITITDPAHRIKKYPTFTVYLDGKVYLSYQLVNSGNFILKGLEPSKKFEIVGSYSFYNEKDVLIESKFYTGNITTLGLDTLQVVKLFYEQNEYFSNKVMFNNVRITNSLNNETLNGIVKAVISINNNTYNISKSNINKLINGESISLSTSEGLKSNSNYDYEILFYDKFNNVLPFDGNKGNTYTIKKIPKAEIKADTNFTESTIYFKIINEDDASINNYFYELYDFNGNLVQSKPLDNINSSLFINNLSSNEEYTINLYADYDLNDGKGTKTHQLIQNYSFNTVNLSKLKSLRVIYLYEQDDIQYSSANVKIKINNDNTDSRLIEMLDYIIVNIYDKNNNFVKDYKVKKSDLIPLDGSTFILHIDGLNSATEYYIDTQAFLKIGDRNYEVEANDNLDSFKTVKAPARLYLENAFESNNFISFDLKIDDLNDAIADKNVIMSMFDSSNKLIQYQTIDTNKESKNYIFDKLDTGKTYRFTFMAASYDLKDGKGAVIKYFENSANTEDPHSFCFTTTNQLSGKLKLNSLLKVIQSEHGNVFDITSKDKWISSGSGIDFKEFNINNNVISLGLKANGGRFYSYYVPELKNQNAQVFFKIKKKKANSLSNTFSFSFLNSKNSYNASTRLGLNIKNDSTNNYDFIGQYLTNKLFDSSNKEDDKQKVIEIKSNIFKVNSNGYITFYLSDTDNSYTDYIDIIDFRIIENPNNYDYSQNDNYKEDPNNLQSNISFNFYDNRIIESSTSIKKINNVFLDICDRDNNCIDNKQYTFNVNSSGNVIYSSDPNSIIPLLKRNNEYTISLKVAVEFNENLIKEYTLDKINFTTEDEIRSINQENDFLSVHNKGKYIVNADLDFANKGMKFLQNSSTSTFYGNIDFQGHKVSIKTNPGTSYKSIIYSLGRSGRVSNAVLNVIVNNTSRITYYSPFVSNNYGKISNIKVNIDVDPSLKVEPSDFVYYGFLVYSNSGTIENFLIENNTTIKLAYYSSLVSRYNDGIIQNGYVIGNGRVDTRFNTDYNGTKNIGLISGYTSGTSSISNVYTVMDTDIYDNSVDEFNYAWQVGNIIGVSNTGSLSNSFSVGSGINRTSFDSFKDYNVGYVNNLLSAKNLYYITNEKINNAYSTNVTLSYLSNIDFIDGVLNKDFKKFNVRENIYNKHYPTLNWPNCMPNQNLYSFSEGTGSGIDYISSEVVNEDKIPSNFYKTNQTKYNTKKLKLKVYNSSYKKITNVGIKGVNTIVYPLEQENTTENYSYVYVKVSTFDEDGKSISGSLYSNKYYLTFIKSQDSDKPREYRDKNDDLNLERRTAIFSLYKEISNTTEWKKIDNSSSNFYLSKDIDFKNCTSTSCYYINNFYGTLDGNGKTLKNIQATTSTGVIYRLYGTIKNMYIDGYTQVVSSGYSGFIYMTNNGSVIDNVHVSNINVKNGTYIGSLVGYLYYGNLTNSSVTGFKVDINDNNYKVDNKTIGGLVGNSYYSIISNCASYDFYYDQTGNLNSGTVGGLVGVLSGGFLTNSIVNGEIHTSSKRAGGLVGRGSGNVVNNITKVDIYSERDYTGGIMGDVLSNSLVNVYSNLTFGNLYSSNTGSYIGRTVGYFRTSTERGINFAYDRQNINGIVSSYSENETLLSEEQLKDDITYKQIIGMDDNFNYSGIKNGFLPQITYSYDNSKIIKSKEISFMKKDGIILTSIEPSKYSTVLNGETVEKINVKLTFDNQYFSDKDITRFYIENEETPIEVSNNASEVSNRCTNNGNTYQCDISFIPYNFYDNYKINKIVLSNKNEIFVNIRVDEQIFKSINSGTEWNNFFEDNNRRSKQNILLTGNIDLSKYKNLTSINSINRIRSEDNNIYEISNVTMNNSFINTVMSEISNVKFSNFIISSSNSYSGIVGNNSGDLKGVEFNHNMIKGRAFVGCIGYDSSNDINDVTVKDIIVYGTDGYVGGFAGRVGKPDITKLYVSNVSVKGVYYVGGSIGYMGTTTGETFSNMNVDNAYVVGDYYVGGFNGYHEYTLSYVTVKNSIIVGSRYVKSNSNAYENSYRIGGVSGGGSGNSYCYANNLNIISNGKETGGITGYAGGSISPIYDYVIDTNIINYKTVDTAIKKSSKLNSIFGNNLSSGFELTDTLKDDFGRTPVHGIDLKKKYIGSFALSDFLYNATSSNSDIGGIMGMGYGSIQYSGVKNSNIYSENGNDIGGLCSKSTALYSHVYNYLNNVSVEGNSNVGGILGSSSSNLSYLNEVEVNVKGNSNVGGAIGYVNNTNATASLYYTRVSNSIFGNSSVEGTEGYTGAIFGKTTVAMNIENKLYNNVIDVNVISPSNDINSYVIGNYHENDINSMLLVYSGSTFKGKDYENPIAIGNSSYNYSLIKDLSYLKNESTYIANVKDKNTNKFTTERIDLNGYWVKNKNLLESNYYPYLYYPNLSGILSEYHPGKIPMRNNLPNTTCSEYRTTESMDYSHILPIYDIYTIDSSKINIDFSKIDNKSYFKIIYHDKESSLIPISNRTFTFNYDFKDDFAIVVTDGYKINNKIISKKNLINDILTIKNDYYYLDDGNIITNDNIIKGNFINLYNESALDDKGNIYNLISKTYDNSNVNGIDLMNTTLPLYQYVYDGIKIQTFNTYSVSNSNILNDKILYVKNNHLYVFSNSLKYYKDSIILDNYNNNTFQTILGFDGNLYDLDNTLIKNEIKKKGIKDITNTLKDGTDIFLIKYEDGSIIGFNYKNSEVLFNTSSKQKLDVISYLKINLSSASLINTGKIEKENFNNDKFISKLKMSDEILNNEEDIKLVENLNINKDSKLVSMYNPIKESYEVYDESILLGKVDNSNNNINNDQSLSVNDIVLRSSNLRKIYFENSFNIFDYIINGVVVLIGILILILMSIFLFGKNIAIKKS